MSDKVNFRVVVLWRSELVLASKAVTEYVDFCEEHAGKKLTDEGRERFDQITKNMVQSCFVALHGVGGDESANLMVLNADAPQSREERVA